MDFSVRASYTKIQSARSCFGFCFFFLLILILAGSVSSRLSCLMPAFNANSNKFLSLEEDIMADSRNLSSTLQKLYIWEKKLEHEVRAEEKLRLLHDKKCRRFKRMFERGAEAHKLDQVQVLIKKLSTQIRIAMQVVDSVSNKINELRDEELWPHIHELIHGLARMWKVMLEYHQIQCRGISEAKSKDSIESDGNLNMLRPSQIGCILSYTPFEILTIEAYDFFGASSGTVLAGIASTTTAPETFGTSLITSSIGTSSSTMA